MEGGGAVLAADERAAQRADEAPARVHVARDAPRPDNQKYTLISKKYIKNIYKVIRKRYSKRKRANSTYH